MQNSRCTALAKSIVDVADNMGLNVVAKGVETEAQFSFFREAGCAEVQGNYFSQPLAADQFASWYLQSGLRAPKIAAFQNTRPATVQRT